MQKQLNPQLFGIQTSPRGLSADAIPDFSQNHEAPQRTETSQALMALDQRIEKLQRQMQEFQIQIAQSTFQNEEGLKALRSKTDRQQITLSQVESSQESLTIETSQKIHFLQQKNIEQRKLEDGIQNLIDRQNGLLKGYEVRLQQLHKLLADKESQMISTLAALNETKAELQRLKRQT